MPLPAGSRAWSLYKYYVIANTTSLPELLFHVHGLFIFIAVFQRLKESSSELKVSRELLLIYPGLSVNYYSSLWGNILEKPLFFNFL